MRVMFVHKNFPAQYRYLAPTLASDTNNQVVFLTARREGEIENISKLIYSLKRNPSDNIHHYLRRPEEAILHGQAAAQIALAAKNKGFTPDLICAHAGFGPAHFLKDVFPDTPLLNYFEWFYNTRGSDFAFLPYSQPTIDNICSLRMKNTALLTDLNACDWGVCPTNWQASQIPDIFHQKLTTLHDGVNVDFMQPAKEKTGLNLPRLKIHLSNNDEVITYVARGMEEYRGFPEFMRTIDIVLKQRPQAHVVIVGEDRVAYGRELPNKVTFKEKMLEEVELDMSRVHFTGLLSLEDLRSVFQASSLHVYLTVPFVLSWSMLEAMACGCVILGSDTEPVQEIIQEGENGFLVDFFDVEKIADRVNELLEQPEKNEAIRTMARETIVERYNLKNKIIEHLKLMETVANRKKP